MVYDALRAYDLLEERSEIDPNRVMVVGESMGGRTGIIAAGIEPGIRGVVCISTSGYGLGNTVPKSNQTLFQKSIDPDVYVGMISPRKVVMIHSNKDDIIPIEAAERTFSFANEPKRFITVGCETHGYCEGMSGELKKALEWISGES
jgi:dienelactone hydrolase